MSQAKSNEDEVLRDAHRLRVNGDVHPDQARTSAILNRATKTSSRATELQNETLRNNNVALHSVIQALRNERTSHAELHGMPTERTYQKHLNVGTVKQLRVAGIMDEFTASSFQHACSLILPNTTNWERLCKDSEPDLLFVESAWNGNDGHWHKKVDKVSRELVSLVKWCRSRNIPTVFWNKEDPVHYNGFISTASLFDYVFTTDLDSIPRYKRALEHSRVYLLPFFGEPKLHNPLNAERAPGFSFAGAYYKRYEERSKDFSSVMDAVKEHGPLTIFDRNFGEDLPQFEFPEEYRGFIVGGLKYSEIEKSYKGFEFGVNLNSVKQSQSMFARRVFDLVLSNTHVVSNYSRGLRFLFGDLVVSSDSRRQIERQISKLCQAEGSAAFNAYAGYIRHLALRRVLTEHTTQDRLAYVASRIWADAPVKDSPLVTVIAKIRDLQDYGRSMRQYLEQTWPNKELVIAVDSDSNIDLPPLAGGVKYAMAGPGDLDTSALTDAPFVAVWSADASYGPHFLEDAMRSFEFGDIDCITRVHNSDDRLGLRQAYMELDSARIMSSVWRKAAMPVIKQGVDALRPEEGRVSGVRIVGLPSYDYAPPGDELVDTAAWDREIAMGSPLDVLLRYAETLEPETAPQPVTHGWDTEVLGAQFPGSGRNPDVKVVPGKDGLLVKSDLSGDKHRYIYARNRVPFTEIVGEDNVARVHMMTRPGVAMSLVVLFLDAAGDRISSQIVPANSNVVLDAPEGTRLAHFGIRVQGSGTGTLLGISFREVQAVKVGPGVPSVDSQLLVTNVYPSYTDLYRNGFVHSRVRIYSESGLRTTVFVLNNKLKPGTYEFEGVDVQVGSQEDLAATIKANHFASVLVHFLDQSMWSVLRQFIDSTPITVWIHGAEIQPWYRRDFNYSSDVEREQAKELSSARMSFWRSIFTSIHPNLHFVLVSRYFAEEVMEDVGMRLPENKYTVIHNCIDSEIFKYQAKDPSDRFRVLSIRPFASRKYANDLSVQAILNLRKHQSFSKASFLIIGDGALFESILEPLKDLENVEIRRQFLSQNDIASLHREYGIFMTPTRMDSQGVSRDEAMSSGLVPVTNAVTAIPEFVDSNSGVLAPAEDAIAMAEGIAELWDNPDKFLELSAAASQRVYNQSRREKTLDAEVELIRRRSKKTVSKPNGIQQEADL